MSEKELCDPRTKDAHIEKYRICEKLVGSEPQTNISSPTDPHIEKEPIFVTKKDKKKTKAIIREQPDIDIVLETLDISDYEEIAEIEPESNDEETIIDYSAPDIESRDEEIFEDIENLEDFRLDICINNYATCSECNKLYEPDKVSTKLPGQILICLNCNFVKYPSHPMSKMRQPCNQQLAKEVPTKEGTLYRPLLTYPTISIKHQLKLLYGQPGFEASCRKC
ncbi:8803_t:CDS:2, partial [Ambispora leptoticha]